jgi:hypothetical protein
MGTIAVIDASSASMAYHQARCQRAPTIDNSTPSVSS